MPKIDINGTVREMTDAELEEMAIEEVEETLPTADERIASLEAQNRELQKLLENLLSKEGSA
ncbi:MAG: hypothetical protein E7598_06035 [Ruminococcaceae bacterium]|nr:hypothetical protein [Oscillospiraceae bacterium]